MRRFLSIGLPGLLLPICVAAQSSQPAKWIPDDQVPFPPTLGEGRAIVTDCSPEFLKAPDTLQPGVGVAAAAPTVDLLFYPGQDYPGKPWSNWGNGMFAGGKYYSAIGDHLAIGGKGDGKHGHGNAFVFEYDPATRKLRRLTDLAGVLKMPADHYTPGKIHSRLDLGSDGWIYFATHRGSEKASADQFNYRGDWVLRTHPETAKTEVVLHAPVPKHAIPNTLLDPQRMILYGGTAPGVDAKVKGIQFFALDLRSKKLLYSGPDGPARSMFLASTTGRVYFVPGNADGQLMRYDPAKNAPPAAVDGVRMGIRAATRETPQGMVFTVSSGQKDVEASIWSFNTGTEETRRLAPLAVGAEAYVASVDVDPTGRYLYYIPGAHGGSVRDNSAVVQFDTRTNQKKVIAFLHPFFQQKYGLALKGTYSIALDAAGEKLYVTWNVSRGTRAWDCCALSVVHIPESERRP